MTGIIIVTHGEAGAYLLEAAEHIVGVKENVKALSITARMSMDEIREKVKNVTEELLKECNSIIYFVDIPGGTPMNVVLPYAQNIERSAVICGVNMSMIVVALNLKDNLEFDNLVDKIILDGKKSICEVKSLLSRKE